MKATITFFVAELGYAGFTQFDFVQTLFKPLEEIKELKRRVMDTARTHSL